ncbi:hypothetical protein IC619_015260 [Hazenella sp. IB182353]|uniref:hypothetical protein n=1 Tax=Polycladospora coralii TaxID=2771432 RepID=UPI0017460B9E|nr:hypothetical protein [Polycladospora coralii]MBS7531830.1 hypothetical protein [Polycladospora coralii]
MLVKVKNIGKDRVVDRLGHRFKPNEEKEIKLTHKGHLTLLAACRYLEVTETKPSKPKTAKSIGGK